MIFNSGGTYSLFEKDLATKVKPLLTALSKKEAILHDLLAKAIKTKNTSSVYWNIIRHDIEIIYKEMDILFSTWSELNIPVRYEMSIKQIQNSISSSTILDKPLKEAVSLLNSNISSANKSLLYTDANSSFQAALIAGKSNILKFTRLTQQTLLSEALINQTVAEGIVTGNLRATADTLTGSLWSKMLAQVDELRFVQAGPFKYTPEYYAELLTRVKFHDAHTFATLAQASNYKTDLVQISSHNTQTAICLPYEGKVYSVSGTSSVFPPLFDTPPYHPNCLHLMYPTFESGMIADGTYDAYADFSNDVIPIPPVPANFIPASERGIL